MLVTVLICTYNRAESLSAVLEGLACQDLPDDLRDQWEVLVVDNNSSDCTRQVIEERAKPGRPLVRYLFEGRQGKSHALNAGVREARGAIVALTDDDVRVPRNWVASVIEAGRRYPNVRAFGGRVLPLWPEQIPAWIQPSGPFARPIVGSVIVTHDRGDRVREYDHTMWAPIGANMFFRREVFRDYGNFRVDLGPTGVGRLYVNEDCEFCFRLMRRHETVLYYPEAIIMHPVAQERFSKRYLTAYFIDAGRMQARERSNETRYRRIKRSIWTGRRAAGHSLQYVRHMLTGTDAGAMHHRCRFCYFGAMSWYLLCQ